MALRAAFIALVLRCPLLMQCAVLPRNSHTDEPPPMAFGGGGRGGIAQLAAKQRLVRRRHLIGAEGCGFASGGLLLILPEAWQSPPIPLILYPPPWPC